MPRSDGEPPREPAGLRESYDRVAAAYADAYFGELDHKPVDRALLALLAEETRSHGPVADVGCGPGHVARFLSGLGADALGIDLSQGMVDVARRLSPGLPFARASMLDLPAGDGEWAGLAALYSIIHVPADDLPRAFGEFRRVLRPGGVALVSFHVGTESVHAEELLGHPVSLDFRFLEVAAVAAGLEDAGLAVEMRLERAPYVPHEYPSTRGYVLARRPAAQSPARPRA